ncbi:MAG: efflux RND transporter periplasmic adaptor subunit [Dehalococcoidia bacterium]
MTSPTSTPGRAGPEAPGAVRRPLKNRIIQKAMLLVVAFALLAAGWVLHGIGSPPGEHAAAPAPAAPAAHDHGAMPPGEAEPPAGPAIRFWTCSMHPQIKRPGPGKCPICFMDLIPVYESGDEGDEGISVLRMGERARRLAEVETAPVTRTPLEAVVRLVGKIAYDETRLEHVAAWVGGRIDRLYVDYTGIPVRKGDHLASLYSPDLVTVQQELLTYLKALRNRPEDANAQRFVEAARRKLTLWGILPSQVEELEREGVVQDHMTIYAPAGGTVIGKDAFEGMYFETGRRLFTIADLSQVWVLLDAYELDMAFVRYGQRVAFETEAYPGRTFEGRIAFVSPVLDEPTRTVRLRVNVPNEDGALKPGMFVRATIRGQVAEDGRVIDPDLSGKWISPMHPEIVKDGPGTCDICGMALVPAEELGYAPRVTDPRGPLTIPETAPLLTGKRAVVYVEGKRGDDIAYVGRVVELGPRASGRYVVLGGLEEGDRVVVRGAFKIDSAVQIRGRPSMMSMREAWDEGAGDAQEAPAPSTVAGVPGAAYHQAFASVLSAYLDLTAALASDDASATSAALDSLRSLIAAVKPEGVGSEDKDAFTSAVAALRSTLPAAKDIAAVRATLPALTAAVVRFLDRFGREGGGPVYEMFCPMAAEGKGAAWLQRTSKVANPYFGAEMLECGEQRREFPMRDVGGR